MKLVLILFTFLTFVSFGQDAKSQGILDVYTFGGATATGVGTALTQGWKDESSYNQ